MSSRFSHRQLLAAPPAFEAVLEAMKRAVRVGKATARRLVAAAAEAEAEAEAEAAQSKGRWGGRKKGQGDQDSTALSSSFLLSFSRRSRAALVGPDARRLLLLHYRCGRPLRWFLRVLGLSLAAAAARCEASDVSRSDGGGGGRSDDDNDNDVSRDSDQEEADEKNREHVTLADIRSAVRSVCQGEDPWRRLFLGSKSNSGTTAASVSTLELILLVSMAQFERRLELSGGVIGGSYNFEMAWENYCR